VITAASALNIASVCSVFVAAHNQKLTIMAVPKVKYITNAYLGVSQCSQECICVVRPVVTHCTIVPDVANNRHVWNRGVSTGIASKGPVCWQAL
jgi:hypothetical protein